MHVHTSVVYGIIPSLIPFLLLSFLFHLGPVVSDIAIFVLKMDVRLQLTPSRSWSCYSGSCSSPATFNSAPIQFPQKLLAIFLLILHFMFSC